MGQFHVSPSGLSSFFDCPAKYMYGRTYRLKEISSELKDGLDVHRLMAGQPRDYVYPSVRAAKLQQALIHHEKEMGLSVVKREYSQRFPLTRTIDLVRIIDALAHDSEGPLLVDYKTANRMWSLTRSGYGDIAPKGAGWQSAAYLTVPPTPEPYKKWPSRICYLVASDNAPVFAYTYIPVFDDFNNLKDAARMVKAAHDKGKFPKNRGYGCRWCDFQAMCYERPGWTELYDDREKKAQEDIETLYGA